MFTRFLVTLIQLIFSEVKPSPQKRHNLVLETEVEKVVAILDQISANNDLI